MTPRWSAGSRRLRRITMSWRRFRRRRSTRTRCCVRIRGTAPQRAHRHAGWAPPALMLMAHRVGAQRAAPLHVFLPALCLLAGCSAASTPGPPAADGHLFTLLPPSYTGVRFRSEEHTSELQSPMYLVCRLLLEKKKTKLRAMTTVSR